MLSERERAALRPEVGARLLLDLQHVDGTRATYAAWLIASDGEREWAAVLDESGEVVIADEAAPELLMLAKLTARGAAKRSADGLPAWPPRVLRWKGPGRQSSSSS